MTELPRYEQQVDLRRGVGTLFNQNVATPDAFGAGVARGLTRVGVGMEQVARAFAARDAVRASADAREAYNRFMEGNRAIMHDPETGFLNQTGGNAIGGRSRVAERLKTLRSEIERGLSPHALREFNILADGLEQGSAQSAIVHESGQLRTYVVDQSNAVIEGALQDAGLSYKDPAASEARLNDALTEYERKADLEGIPPARREVDRAKIVQQSYSDRAVLMAQDDPVAAAAFVEENRERLGTDEYIRLSNGLRPAVVQAEARAVVAPFLQGLAPEVDAYGVPRWLVQAESSGDRFADNRLSSALGRTQILDDTYREAVGQMIAQGAAPWAVGLTDEEVLATRTDPALESEVTLFLLGGKRSALTRRGFPVTRRNEYAMWHFGNGGGMALLLAEQAGQRGVSVHTVLSNALGSADADEIIRANPYMRGMTLGALLNTLDRRSGGSGVSSPRAAYDAIMAIEDPEVRAAALAQLDGAMKANDALAAREQEAAATDAWNRVVTEGIDPTDLPVEQQLALGPTAMASLIGATATYKQGVDVTNEARYLELYGLARSMRPEDREAFRGLNLIDDAENLSRGDLRALLDMQAADRAQADLLASGRASEVVYTDEDLSQTINRAQEHYDAATARHGFTTDEMGRVNFARQLENMLRTYANETGQQMPRDMVDRAIGQLLIPVQYDRRWWGGALFRPLADAAFRTPGAPFDVQVSADMIPTMERERIAAEMLSAWGRPPTEDEIVSQYEREVLASIGLTADIPFDEIPVRAVAQMTAQTDMTEEEIVANYMRYMHDQVIRARSERR